MRIGEYLGIPSELLFNDLIGHVVHDLISAALLAHVHSNRPHAIYIEDKIKINYTESADSGCELTNITDA